MTRLKLFMKLNMKPNWLTCPCKLFEQVEQSMMRCIRVSIEAGPDHLE